jgi:arsenite methyltransferase
MTTTDDHATADELLERVRTRYAAAATAATAVTAVGSGGCCGERAESCCGEAGDAADAGEGFGAALYTTDDQAAIPVAATLASLGCGNPTAVAGLGAGETVLDLGSGGGIDVLLSARRVGPTGFAYGLDMTDEMLDLARRNAAEAGADNVEFLKGRIEEIPLADASIDVIISNCVINLSVDKPAVFAEMSRVLRPGGRIGVSDVVAEDQLSPAELAERGSFVGCIAGALSTTAYREGLESVGFADVEITFTHEVADGLHGAIIRARRP